jgi:hypothetical protein
VTRLYEAMPQIDQFGRLHSIILDDIAKLSPECAEAIVVRLGEVATDWGGRRSSQRYAPSLASAECEPLPHAARSIVPSSG